MYKLLQKSVGTKQIEDFAEIKIDTPIYDICSSDKLGYFFVSNQCIGHIDLNGKVKFPFIGQEGEKGDSCAFRDQVLFSDPSAICYNSSNKLLLVLEDNGRLIRGINTEDDYYCSILMTKEVQAVLNHIYSSPYPQSKNSISSCGHNICWASSLLNRFFVAWGFYTMRVFGNGHAGYSTSNHESKYSLNCPSGIDVKDNIVYVSDKNNHCIRMFGGETGHSICFGNPTSSNLYPEKIIVDKKIFYIDGKGVYAINSLGEKAYNVYSSESIISICHGLHKNKISILIKE